MSKNMNIPEVPFVSLKAEGGLSLLAPAPIQEEPRVILGSGFAQGGGFVLGGGFIQGGGFMLGGGFVTP